MLIANRLLRGCAFGLALLAASCSVLTASAAAAQEPAVSTAAVEPIAQPVVPSLIRFAGKLPGHGGERLTVRFAVYDSVDGSPALWSEYQTVSIGQSSEYSAFLGAGSANGLPPAIFASGQPRWLGIQAGNGAEERVLIASVPYAMKSADAENLAGRPVSEFVTHDQLIAQLNAEAKAAPIAAVAAASLPDAAAAVSSLTGSGTAKYLPVWTGASTLADSALYQTGTDASPRVGIGTSSPASTLDVDGGATVRGALEMPAAQVATASSGTGSGILELGASAYSSTAKAAVAQKFAWQVSPANNNTASPSSNLNLEFGAGTAAPVATGLSISPKGVIAFAPGQTFPVSTSSPPVQAGFGLISNTSPTTEILSVDGSKIPTLGANNLFAASQIIDGDVGIGTSAPSTQLEVAARAPSALGPTLTLTNAGGDGGSASVDFKTYLHASTAHSPTARIVATDDNNYGTSISFISKTPGSDTNGLQTNMTIASYGNVGIGTVGPTTALELSANAPQGLGPILTITNTGGNDNSDNSAASIDFKTYLNDVTTDSPSARIEAIEAEGADIIFWARDEPGNQPLAKTAIIDAAGDMTLFGTLFASSKKFRIDHPADPANKYLVHTSVESSEDMNIYTGNAITDELGLATVKLPDWFEVENGDFRYQLTVVGRQAQAWIAEEVGNGQFKIATNASHVKVSWQITAIRQDAYAKAHPLVVEQSKSTADRGHYVHPELYGQPMERQVGPGSAAVKPGKTKPEAAAR